jgi:putative DNA primase/helicase
MTTPPTLSNGMTLLDQALQLASIGCSVVPSGKPGRDGKKKAPWVPWTELQKRRATVDEIKRWDAEIHPTLWGYVTGEISGHVVFDIDHLEIKALFDAAGLKPYKRTRKGFHYPFKWPGHFVKTTESEIMPRLDVRGDGGFINAIGQNEDAEYEMIYWPTKDNLYELNRLPQTVKSAWQKLSGNVSYQQKGIGIKGLKVPVGERNGRLTSLAGTLKNKGLSTDAIFYALKSTYETDFEHDPPILDNEIRAIVEQSVKWKIFTKTKTYNLTDLGNMERLINLHGENFRYCEGPDIFYVWNGKYWESGNHLVKELAKTIPATMYAKLTRITDDEKKKEVFRWIMTSENNNRLTAMVELAKSDPRIHTFPDHYDKDLYALNCRNGTVDLRNGQIRPHNREDYITRIIDRDYIPNLKSEVWETFIKKIIPDEATRNFVWQAIGYSANGIQNEQTVIFCYGEGKNGKSTLLNSCRVVLGPYGFEVEPSVFMQRKYGRDSKSPDEEIGNLHRKRFVTATELEENETLAVNLLKRASGGEELTCNMKYAHSFKFKPEFTLWMSGNHQPKIIDRTNSTWRRLRLIPFQQEIPENERIKGYADILINQHGNAILSWIVAGAVACYETGGLKASADILEATDTYRLEQDNEWQFLHSDRAFVDDQAKADSTMLYDVYKTWWIENIEGNVALLGKKKFNDRLKKLGFWMKSGSGNRNYWTGIGIINDKCEEN